MQPSAPDASRADLVTGEYRLTLTMATTGKPICAGGFCTSSSLCASTGNVQPVSISEVIKVRAERTGDDFVIRPVDSSATFRINLKIDGTAVGGTASGEFRSGQWVVAIGDGTSQSAATVTGIVGRAPIFVLGALDGGIMMNGSGCSNNAHRWSLDALLP